MVAVCLSGLIEHFYHTLSYHHCNLLLELVKTTKTLLMLIRIWFTLNFDLKAILLESFLGIEI